MTTPPKHLFRTPVVCRANPKRQLWATSAAFVLFAAFAGPAFAQLDGLELWQEVDTPREVLRDSAALTTQGNEIIVPPTSLAFTRNKDAMEKLLAQAPRDTAAGQSRANDVSIVLPLPDGEYQRFKVRNSPLMSDQLAAQFPDIKSYKLQGIDDPTATGRIDTSPQGFRAMVLSEKGTFFIDPHWQKGNEISICYDKKDLSSAGKTKEWSCGVTNSPTPTATPAKSPTGTKSKSSSAARPSGNTIRLYRAAIAATAEYTAFHGGTFGGALAAINATLTRVNAVFEREFSIRLQLVAPLIYFNPSTDPYTNGNTGDMIMENQTEIDNVVGDANYDIGHVFGTGGGGLAGLGVACVSGRKAMGVSNSPRPTGDSFDVALVCHEFGHQFGANHTFNAVNGNIAPGTAYEPASGNTIMSYAGVIAGQDLQQSADDYFHGASYTEIDNFVTLGAGAATRYQFPTANTPPVVLLPQPTYFIPAQTPFALTAIGSDVDGDSLTYCWEQFDLGPAQDWSTANPIDNGASPIFRSYAPTTNRTRFFPSLTYVLNNTNTPPVTYSRNGVGGWITGEVLPTTARTMNFRVSVRDNRAGGGGQDWASLQVITTLTAGPFRINSHNVATNIPTDTPFVVTWDPANTFSPPVSCSSVNISFSTDGGTSFPIPLAANAPNTGSATVSIPERHATANGRIKIEGAGNIFFDVNDANLRVLSANAALLGQLTDRGAPRLRVKWPKRSTLSTKQRQITLKGSASDNIKLSRLQYRLKGPYNRKFGKWKQLPLSGDPNRQDWVLPVALPARGTWLVQVRSRDAVGYSSPSRFLTITRD